MLLGAMAEAVSLGAVLPFLGVLSDPEKVFNNPFVHDIFFMMGVSSSDGILFPVTIAFSSLALMAGVIRLLLLWLSTRLAYASGVDLSIKIYRRTLYQPYWVHLEKNSSEVISGITSKVHCSVNVLYQTMTAVISLLLLIAVMWTLMLIDPVSAMVATSVFAIIYSLIAWFSQRKLRSNGERIADAQTKVVKALQEGLGGIRDVLLDGTQELYCDIYQKSDRALWVAAGENVFIGGSPRFVMESLGMVLIAMLAYWMSQRTSNASMSVPILGAMALGAQRVLPALQQIYNAWTNIVGSVASVRETVDLLDQPLPESAYLPHPLPLKWNRSIRFEQVEFGYNSGGDARVLSNCTFEVAKGSRVGIVGATGSGKSTLLNLLMGLLQPTDGMILVDNRSLTGDTLRSWQRNIAHVPQNVFLADMTIAENIAFGVKRDAIDMEKVRLSAKLSQIDQFIESLPEGYQTVVGERGSRISGGQRQRIGIARALYKDADVLIFDEATSALDSETEKLVVEAINGLGGHITVWMIAHRLSTLQQCDRMFEVKSGRVVELQVKAGNG